MKINEKDISTDDIASDKTYREIFEKLNERLSKI